MHIYAVAIGAFHPDGYFDIIAVSMTAESDEEAVSRGLEVARGVWPEGDGWSNHLSAEKRVPQEQLDLVKGG
jgi:hypothetical protein